MAVIEISMAARSAIEGGLTSREALLMNDIYLKQLAECSTVNQIFALKKKEACLEFARVEKVGKKHRGAIPILKIAKKIFTPGKRRKLIYRKLQMILEFLKNIC